MREDAWIFLSLAGLIQKTWPMFTLRLDGEGFLRESVPRGELAMALRLLFNPLDLETTVNECARDPDLVPRALKFVFLSEPRNKAVREFAYLRQIDQISAE